MRCNCEGYQDAIWEHAKTGRDLPSDVRSHIDRCPECRRALIEAQRLTAALPADNYEQTAPDCRAAVMSRITPRRPVRRYAWAFASVACVLAGLTAFALFGTRGRAPRSVQPVVERNAPERGVIARNPNSQPEHAPAPGDKPLPLPQRDMRPTPLSPGERAGVRSPFSLSPGERAGVRGQHHKHRHPEPTHTPAAQPDSDAMVAKSPQADIGPTRRPIAAVAVVWPQGDEDPNTSYSYTERDSATGAVTSCSVRREGDTVEIHMESTAGGERPPVRGSIQHDEPNNA